MGTLARLELDEVDITTKVETWLKHGAKVSLFSRSTGSGEACHLTVGPNHLELFSAAEIINSFQDRAKSYWDIESGTILVGSEYHRTSRGKITYYLKVRGKETN